MAIKKRKKPVRHTRKVSGRTIKVKGRAPAPKRSSRTKLRPKAYMQKPSPESLSALNSILNP